MTDPFSFEEASKPTAASSKAKGFSFEEAGLPEGQSPARGVGGLLKDVGAWALKGAIAVPEAAVGLADIPTGGRVGKFLENEGGAVGFRPKEAKAAVNEWHTDATKDAQRKFQEAEGIGGKFQVALENPSNIVGSLIESAPLMGAGGVAARGLIGATRLGQMGAQAAARGATGAEAAAASARGAAIAGAAGEGITMAGSQAEAIRQETPDGLLTPGQTGAAALTGVIGGAVGGLSGRLANKMGIGDVDTMLAQGARGAAGRLPGQADQQLHAAAAKSIPSQVIKGAITEGLLEELPQSVAEQVLQNLALDKDWTNGLDDAIVLGILAGGAMGAGASGLHAYQNTGAGPSAGAPGAADTPGESPAPAAPAQLGYNPDPLIAFPDGTVGRRADVEAYVAGLPEHQQGATRARLMGLGAQPADAPAAAAPSAPVSPGLARVREAFNTQLQALQEQEGGEPDVPQTTPPDGAAILAQRRQAELDAGRAALSPDDEILQSTGVPLRPSEKMGLDPKAGALSAAAVVAVDTGAYMPPAGQLLIAPPEPEAEADPVVLQNRDRTSAASIAQMQEIAASPDYLRTGPSREMTSGAPVVFGELPASALLGRAETVVDGKGGRVETQYAVVDAGDLLASNNADGTTVQEYASGAPGKLRAVAGNGRTAGIQAAYGLGTAAQYQQDMAQDAASLGLDPQAITAMQRPVLVRVMGQADVTGDMGDRTNIAPTQKLSPTEQAGNDARRFDVGALSFDDGGSPTPQSINGFVNSMPVAERGDLLNTDGTPTRQAVDRLMAATFKQAYESDELVQLYAQATDPDARAVMAAAADASGVLANLKGTGEFDVRAAVADAAKMAVNAARQGLKLSDVLKNADIDMNPEAYPIAEFMAQNLRSPKKMAEGLRRWGQLALEQAQIAEDNTRQGGLLGPTPTLTRAEIFTRIGSGDNPANQAITRAAPEAPAPAQQADLAQEPAPAQRKPDTIRKTLAAIRAKREQENNAKQPQAQAQQAPVATESVAPQDGVSSPDTTQPATGPAADENKVGRKFSAQIAQPESVVSEQPEPAVAPAAPSAPTSLKEGIAQARAKKLADAATKAAQNAKENQPTATATQAPPATESVAKPAEAPAPKPAKKQSVVAKVAAAQQARAEYFAPGNIVAGYDGHDRVISYTPTDKDGAWSVTVQAVEQQGDKWVDAPNSKPRTHSTQPDARALKAGFVVVAKAEGQDSPALDLTAPTKAELLAKQEAQEAADKQKAKDEAKAAAAEKAARDKKDVDARMDASADNFVLGQDANDALSGQAGMFDAQQNPSAPSAPAAKPATYGAKNTLVSQSRADELRAKLREKAKNNLFGGLDTEMMAWGTELAAFHLEAGVRKFADFVATMASDLGTRPSRLKPYLRSWYNGARDLMEDHGLGIEGMDSVDAVRAEIAKIATETEDTPDPQGKNDAPDTHARVERDSQIPATEPAVGDAVSPDAAGAASTTGEAGGRAGGSNGRGQLDGVGVPFGSSPVAGDRGDQRLHIGEPVPELESILAGDQFGERGGDGGVGGVPLDHIPASKVEATAEPRTDPVKAGIERARANKAPVSLGDIDSIKATLPQLHPGQQEDVLKAEKRFADPKGYGMLFTNGTGTGKTFSGLGVVKRFALQGKNNTLIVVPDDKIASDWMKLAKLLGLDVSQLSSTKDSGKGIVITSYANLGENDELASRQWDLVVADEAHTLMQSADGAQTGYLKNLRAITHHPDGASTRHDMLHRDQLEQERELRERIGANIKIMNADDTMDAMVSSLRAENAKLEPQLNKLTQELRASREAVKGEVAKRQGAARTRLVALSATPFAYEKTVDWANGYLFEYKDGYPHNENSTRYNQPSPREYFFQTRFGYRMRYNKLTAPDAKVDSGLMQRQFNAELKKSGALSGRMLDVPHDYDRRFVLVNSAIGNRIDEALEWLNEQRQAAAKGDTGMSSLAGIINDQFKFLQKRYLLEAIKATEAVPIIRQHLALGRKVVVFHDYKKGGASNPFKISLGEGASGDQKQLKAALDAFNTEFADLINHPLLESADSPIEVFSRELPGTLLVNGDEKKADLLARYQSFQDDTTGPQVMLVQSAKNKGWSGHDTTGKHQRVLINLGQPTAPTLAVQQEGRIYRTGQASDAIMRYLNTGTNWERWAFASTIASRASTAENLGMGEMARALKDSFIQSFEESDTYAPGHEGEGKGGKERDTAANNALTEYDRARALYFANEKKNSRTKAQEGADYFATPEPVGLKMVEWLDARIGESVLEPSGGHGAIARWFPEKTNKTVIEPSLALRSRLALAMNAAEDRIIGGTFEDHLANNKYDGIAMNPPFGVGGKTAIEHLSKAATHLRDGGRIVALIPTGPAADKRFDKWMYEKAERPTKPLHTHAGLGAIHEGDILTGGAATGGLKLYVGHVDKHSDGRITVRPKGETIKSGVPIGHIVSVTPGPRTEEHSPAENLHLVADVLLPTSTFERAGTAVMTRIVVIEKHEKAENAPASATRQIDLTSVESTKELFDRLEDMNMPPRPKVDTAEEAPQASPAKVATTERNANARAQTAQAGAIVKLGGKDYEVAIYTTNAGKELRGVWMKTREQAAQFTNSPFQKRPLGWFVRETAFPVGALQQGAHAFSRTVPIQGASAPSQANAGDFMSPDLARAILALSRPPQQATKESVRAAVRELVNGLGLLPNSLGRVVVATAAEIKQDWEPLIGPTGMEASGDAGRAQGFYDPKSKTVFLIADHIRQGDELGVVAHELMHKHGPAVLGKAGWDRLHGAIGGWAKAKPGSMERIVYDEAARRVQTSAPELSNQELFPYAVQVALEMGVRPNAMAPQGTVARWLGQVRSALRQVWSKIAGGKGDFNALDLVNLAFGIAQRENPAHAGELDGAVGTAKENLLKPSVSAVDAKASERGSATTSGDVSTVSNAVQQGKATAADVARELNRQLALDVKPPGGMQFSRSTLSDLKASAIDQIHQTLSHPGKVSLWDKTVGTMRHLAERNPAFKPVFEAAQRHIDDVSTLANDAADAAPRILPRVDNWRDLGKKPVAAADNKAVGKALFDGTLAWGRDEGGKPVLVKDLQQQYANLSAEEKGQKMLAAGKLDAGVLRMWRGLPMDQFENLINSRFESKMLKAGLVWSDKELSGILGLNGQQIGLYRETRAAVDRSIDMTSRADMLRVAGPEYAALRDAVLEQPTLQGAMELLTSALVEDAKADPQASDRLMQLHNQVVDRATQARELMDAGYMPLSRFGQYTLDVVDAAGERQYFGMFESKREANQMKLRMRSAFPGAAVVQGTMSQQAFKLFQGVTPESLELFGNMLGLDSEGNEAKDKAFQEYLKLAKNNHSALKRLIHRQGIAGYSEDVGRVLASFVYSNARQAAGALNAGTMEKALQAIPKEQGELKDVALGLRSYISDPQEEGQAVRGMLFAQYLGGSVASAFVNMTQPFAVTMPWLSQFGGMKKASQHLAGALRDMGTRGFKYEAGLAHALQAAQDDGVVSPQEIHQLMAQSRGAGGLRSGDGTRTGDARAATANAWERTKVAWGQPFALAEQFNRRSTFIAAYRLAQANGNANPAEFARKAVLETQFLYSKANKMRWARGAVGGTLMTFKTYTVSYLELMQRTWNAGVPGSPERAAGRRAVAWGMVMLMLMGGAGGLPFLEDVEDVVDALAQMMGYNVSSKQWRQQAMADVLGREFSEFLDKGLSGLPGVPVDVSGRLGMGNLIPGTGLLQTKPNHTRDMLELAGPAGDLVGRAFSGAGRALQGDVAGAALDVSPAAVRNAAKGVDMAATGIYKDTKGYKVIDTTLAEAAAKLIGFQPKSVADVQEANSFMLRSKSFYTQTSSEIQVQWAKALFDKDDAALQRVRERLEAWNKSNPDQPIAVRLPDVWRRVREMGKDRTQRIADTAPKALRAQMREDLARVREGT